MAVRGERADSDRAGSGDGPALQRGRFAVILGIFRDRLDVKGAGVFAVLQPDKRRRVS